MRSALSVAVAALLVSSLLSVAIVAAAPTPHPASPGDSSTPSPETAATSLAAVQTDGTTTRLGLDGSTEHGYTDPAPDLGTTLVAKDDELRQEWAIHDLQYRWSELNRTERIAGIEAAERRINDRIAKLEEREQAVARAMVSGEATPSRTLRTLARNNREASILKERLGQLSALSDDVAFYSLDTVSTEAALDPYEGPVRDRAFGTISATNPVDSTGAVLVETAESGVVVSTTVGGTYLREATRYDNRNLELPSQYPDRSDGGDRLAEIYPWVHTDGNGESTSLAQYPSIQQFSFETYHEQGHLQAYLDSGTTEIFRENQELRIGDLPVESAGEWTGESTTVALNATPRDGPIQFTVRNSATGAPVDATIVVDGRPVAQTGSDGTAWVVRPMAGTEFVVRTDEESITVDPDR